jgi:hypothetical protein
LLSILLVLLLSVLHLAVSSVVGHFIKEWPEFDKVTDEVTGEVTDKVTDK